MKYAEDINEMVAICHCGRRMTALNDAWFCPGCPSTQPERMVHWLKWEKMVEDARDVVQEIRDSLKEAGDEHFVE